MVENADWVLVVSDLTADVEVGLIAETVGLGVVVVRFLIVTVLVAVTVVGPVLQTSANDAIL